MGNRLSLIMLLLLVSCQVDFFTPPPVVPLPEQRPPFSFPLMTNLEDKAFDSGTNSMISALTVDDSNNVYILGYFDGSMDGVTSEANDIFLIKMNSSGEVVWKKHINSSTPGINSASASDFTTGIIWNKQDDAVYFFGDTHSSLVETNTTATYDLYFAKVRSDGNLSWIKHYGQETRDALLAAGYAGLDTDAVDRAGNILMSPDHKLVLTFQTEGSLFETSAGLYDIGIFKVNPSNGAIISGRQLGADTLSDWATAEGIAVSGSNTETLTEGNFAFDGNLIVVPFRTKSALVETNPSNISDAAHVIFNADLSINTLKQLGPETYAAWVAEGNYSGSIAGDNQYRSVVVNGPGDYLFFGKSTGNVTEVGQNSDYFFTRYINGALENMIQYGSTTMPTGTINEEARAMMKDENGRIYCMGHTRSSLFEGLQDSLNPLVFRVNANGEFQEGIQVGTTTAPTLGVDMHYSVIQTYNFVIKDGKLLVAFNNDPVATSSFDSHLWGFTMP